jgi:hypothetical protein
MGTKPHGVIPGHLKPYPVSTGPRLFRPGIPPPSSPCRRHPADAAKGIAQKLRARPAPSAPEKGANPHAPFSGIFPTSIKPAAQAPPLIIVSKTISPKTRRLRPTHKRRLPCPPRAAHPSCPGQPGGYTPGFPHPPATPFPPKPLHPPAPPRNSIWLDLGGKGRSYGGFGLGKPKTLRSAATGRTLPAQRLDSGKALQSSANTPPPLRGAAR